MASEATRARVIKAARELGYRSNFASRSLVSRRTRTLGVYIPPSPWAGLGYSYDDTILRGVETACRLHGYDLLMVNVAGDQSPQVCLDKLAERRVDGLILIHVEAGAPWVGELVAGGHAVVAVDYSGPEHGVDAMVFDNRAVGRVAVEHLVGLGHDRIGFVGSCRDPQNRDAVLRLDGFREAMAATGLAVRPEWVVDRESTAVAIAPDDLVCQKEARLAFERIEHLGAEAPTAWVAYCDLVAATLVPLLRAAGVDVPTRMSLMGVDDSEWCGVVDPPLTSVGHPLEAMGRRAVERLLDRMACPTDRGCRVRAGVSIVFPPTVVPRLSTGPRPAPRA